MLRFRILVIGSIVAALGAPLSTSAQGRPDPAALISAQQEALSRFSMMDGEWRGPASMLLPSGEKLLMTQTERVGPFLDESVRVIEGRGYDEGGEVVFNALAIVSFNPDEDTYSMRSYARGQAGDFAIEPTDDGFKWEIPAGPTTIRYTAVISDSTWHEVGDRIMPDGESIRFFEMNLTRVGDTSWPAAGAVHPE